MDIMFQRTGRFGQNLIDTQEKKIRQRINTLKVKISKFRDQIQNI